MAHLAVVAYLAVAVVPHLAVAVMEGLAAVVACSAVVVLCLAVVYLAAVVTHLVDVALASSVDVLTCLVAVCQLPAEVTCLVAAALSPAVVMCCEAVTAPVPWFVSVAAHCFVVASGLVAAHCCYRTSAVIYFALSCYKLHFWTVAHPAAATVTAVQLFLG